MASRRTSSISPIPSSPAASALAGLGRVLVMQGRLREALVYYERALVLAPGLVDVREEAEMLRTELRDGA